MLRILVLAAHNLGWKISGAMGGHGGHGWVASLWVAQDVSQYRSDHLYSTHLFYSILLNSSHQ